MTNQQGAPEALRPIARYKIGYHTDEWGMRDSTPSGIPDHRGAWVLYKDHVAAMVKAQQPAPSAAAEVGDDLRDRLVAISEAVADQDDRAAQAMLREILAAPQPTPHATGRQPASATTGAPVGVEPAQWQKRHQLRTNGEWENTNEHDAKWWRDNSQGWEIRALYTPQPTHAQAGAVSLSIAEEERMLAQWDYELHGDRARYIEAAHGIGIKGGQHGTE